jgi:hypothetical protein
MLELPSWAVYLGIELFILLIVVIVILMVAWQRSSTKYRKLTTELAEQLKDRKRKLKDCKDGHSENVAASNQTSSEEDSNALREDIKTLKIQLEQARNNPFMQEKIDALTAENEDLQAELDALRHR